MSTPEGRIKALVKRQMKKNFPDAWRFMPVQSGYGVPALDFIYCVGGLFVTIETKKDSKSPLTPTQLSTAGEITKADGLVHVVYDEATCAAAIANIHLALRFKCTQTTPTPICPATLDLAKAAVTLAPRAARSKGSNDS